MLPENHRSGGFLKNKKRLLHLLLPMQQSFFLFLFFKKANRFKEANRFKKANHFKKANRFRFLFPCTATAVRIKVFEGRGNFF